MPKKKKYKINGSPVDSTPGSVIRNQFVSGDGSNPAESLKSLQEIFRGKLDGDVVQLVFSECGFNVDQALESLFTLTTENEFETSQGRYAGRPPSWAESSIYPSIQSKVSNYFQPSASNFVSKANRDASQKTSKLSKHSKFSRDDQFYEYLGNRGKPRTSWTAVSNSSDSSSANDSDLTDTFSRSRRHHHLADVVCHSSESKSNVSNPVNEARNSTHSYVNVDELRLNPNSQPVPPVLEDSSLNKGASSSDHSFNDGLNVLLQTSTNPNLTTSNLDNQPAVLDQAKLLIEAGERVLLVLRGLPGSGKSTLAKLLRTNGIILSTDDYFNLKGTYNFNPCKLSEAHEWNKERALAAIKDCVTPVIIDNTNTQAWEMKPYIIMALRNNYVPLILEPDTPWKFQPSVLAKKNIHCIPKESIAKMLERYEHRLTVEDISSKSSLFKPPPPSNIVPTKITIEPVVESSSSSPTNSLQSRSSGSEAAKTNAQNVSLFPERLGLEDLKALVLQDSEDSLSASRRTSASSSQDASGWECDEEFTWSHEELGGVATCYSHYLPDEIPEEDGDESDEKLLEENHLSPLPMVEDNSQIDSGHETESTNEPVDNSPKSTDESLVDQLETVLSFSTVPEAVGESKTDPPLKSSSIFEPIIMDEVMKELNLEDTSEEPRVSLVDEYLTISGDDLEEDRVEIMFPVETKCNRDVRKYNFLRDPHELNPFCWNKLEINTKVTDTNPPPLRSPPDSAKWENIDTVAQGPLDQASSAVPKPPAITDMTDWSIPSYPDEDSASFIVFKANLIANKTTGRDVEAQTTAKDFAILDNIETEIISDIVVLTAKNLSDSDCDLTPLKMEVRNPPVFDKSTTTEDLECKLNEEEKLKILTGMFPAVTKEDLEDILAKCKGDHNWAINSLLDFGLEYNDPSTHIEPLKSLLVETKPLEEPASSTEPKDVDIAEPEVLNSAAEKEDHTLQLLLPFTSEFVAQLEEMFGPIPGKSSQNETVELSISVELAQTLHQLCKNQLQSGKHTWNQRLKQNNLGSPKASVSDTMLLSEIMEMEEKTQKQMQKINKQRIANGEDMATRLKRQKLHKLFPGVDPLALDDVFESNNHSLAHSLVAVEEALGHGPYGSPLFSSEVAQEAEEELICQALQESQQENGAFDNNWLAWVSFDQTDNPRQNAQLFDFPNGLLLGTDYEDHRAEANVHFEARQECYKKAQEAYRRGMKAVVSFYSYQARLHNDKLKDANRRAAEKILERRNNGHNQNVLDLHGLHVGEAVTALEHFLQTKYSELENSPLKRFVLFVITGRGLHSNNSQPRLLPAVEEFLKRKDYRFEAVHQGVFKIILT